MNSIEDLPSPEAIIERINSCREELAALKKLLRASQAAVAADEARRRRHPTGRGQRVNFQSASAGEVSNASR
jgi:hypothetical protein